MITSAGHPSQYKVVITSGHLLHSSDYLSLTQWRLPLSTPPTAEITTGHLYTVVINSSNLTRSPVMTPQCGVVFDYLWSPMHVSETEYFLMTSYCVLEINNGEQRKMLAFSIYNI